MKRVAIAMLAVAIAVGAGAGAVALTTGNARRRRVIVVGDSITSLQATKWHTLDGALGGAYDYTFVAPIAKRIDQIQPAADHVLSRSHRSDDVVVNVGTNDMEESWPDWEASFDQMWRAVAEHPCVVYITIRQVPGRPIGAAINRRIRRLASQHPNVRVWDWNEYLRGPSGHDPKHVLLFDSVHPTPDGARAISEGTRRALDSC